MAQGLSYKSAAASLFYKKLDIKTLDIKPFSKGTTP